MFRIGTARRVILSASVPLLMVLCLHHLEFRVNERPAAEGDWFAGALAKELPRGSVTVFETFVLRDAWWYWPAIVVLSSAWLWVLWDGKAPAGPESPREV